MHNEKVEHLKVVATANCLTPIFLLTCIYQGNGWKMDDRLQNGIMLLYSWKTYRKTS